MPQYLRIQQFGKEDYVQRHFKYASTIFAHQLSQHRVEIAALNCARMYRTVSVAYFGRGKKDWPLKGPTILGRIEEDISKSKQRYTTKRWRNGRSSMRSARHGPVDKAADPRGRSHIAGNWFLHRAGTDSDVLILISVVAVRRKHRYTFSLSVIDLWMAGR